MKYFMDEYRKSEMESSKAIKGLSSNQRCAFLRIITRESYSLFALLVAQLASTFLCLRLSYRRRRKKGLNKI